MLSVNHQNLSKKKIITGVCIRYEVVIITKQVESLAM